MKRCTKCKIEFPATIEYFYIIKKTNILRSWCKECLKKQSKRYTEDNIERIKKYQKIYRIINKEKIKRNLKIYLSENKGKYDSQKKEYRKRKRKTDFNFRLNDNMSGAIYRSLKGNKNGWHWEDLVGYTQIELRNHLEAQFKNGMTWNNYGRNGWHIDHIIPKSIFNITTIKSKGFKKCWDLNNLRPMWERENIIKSNKLFT